MAVGRYWLYSLMLRLQLVAGGDVILLDVEMNVGRYW